MEWSSAEPTDATAPPAGISSSSELTSSRGAGSSESLNEWTRPQFRDQLPRLLCDPSLEQQAPGRAQALLRRFLSQWPRRLDRRDGA